MFLSKGIGDQNTRRVPCRLYAQYFPRYIVFLHVSVRKASSNESVSASAVIAVFLLNNRLRTLT